MFDFNSGNAFHYLHRIGALGARLTHLLPSPAWMLAISLKALPTPSSSGGFWPRRCGGMTEKDSKHPHGTLSHPNGLQTTAALDKVSAPYTCCVLGGAVPSQNTNPSCPAYGSQKKTLPYLKQLRHCEHMRWVINLWVAGAPPFLCVCWLAVTQRGALIRAIAH